TCCASASRGAAASARCGACTRTRAIAAASPARHAASSSFARFFSKSRFGDEGRDTQTSFNKLPVVRQLGRERGLTPDQSESRWDHPFPRTGCALVRSLSIHANESKAGPDVVCRLSRDPNRMACRIEVESGDSLPYARQGRSLPHPLVLASSG